MRKPAPQRVRPVAKSGRGRLSPVKLAAAFTVFFGSGVGIAYFTSSMWDPTTMLAAAPVRQPDFRVGTIRLAPDGDDKCRELEIDNKTGEIRSRTKVFCGPRDKQHDAARIKNFKESFKNR